MGIRIGAVAQLGERCVRNAEVGSSTLLRSTFSVQHAGYGYVWCALKATDGSRPPCNASQSRKAGPCASTPVTFVRLEFSTTGTC